MTMVAMSSTTTFKLQSFKMIAVFSLCYCFKTSNKFPFTKYLSCANFSNNPLSESSRWKNKREAKITVLEIPRAESGITILRRGKFCASAPIILFRRNEEEDRDKERQQ